MQLSVAEDAPIGTLITALAVTDADEGGTQSVSSSSNSTLFRVDDQQKLVVAQGLKGYAGERVTFSILTLFFRLKNIFCNSVSKLHFSRFAVPYQLEMSVNLLWRAQLPSV